MATPHANRKIDVFSHSLALPYQSDEQVDLLPSSGLRSNIPDSIPGTVKKTQITTNSFNNGAGIAETPSKPSHNSHRLQNSIFASPDPLSADVPDSATKTTPQITGTPERAAVESTPVRPRSQPQNMLACPSTPVPLVKSKGTSPNIYDTLGWNDYELDD
jgi:hypothetical protein